MKMSHESFVAMCDKVKDQCKGATDPEIVSYIKAVDTIRRNGVNYFNGEMTRFVMEQMLREYVTGIPLLGEWDRSMVIRGFIVDAWHDQIKSVVGDNYSDNDTTIGEVVWEVWVSTPVLAKWNDWDNNQ